MNNQQFDELVSRLSQKPPNIRYKVGSHRRFDPEDELIRRLRLQNRLRDLRKEMKDIRKELGMSKSDLVCLILNCK